jgi:hypothetical protein
MSIDTEVYWCIFDNMFSEKRMSKEKPRENFSYTLGRHTDTRFLYAVFFSIKTGPLTPV